MSIAVSPEQVQVAAGFTQQFTAIGTYSDGSTQPVPAPVWATSFPFDATTSGRGLVTSHHPGTVSIMATSGSVQGTATLTIGAPVLTSISVSPASVSWQVGADSSPQEFTAAGYYSDQSSVDITNQAKWGVTNPYVATVSADGFAQSVRNGFTKVTATLDKVTGSAGLTGVSSPRFLYEATDYGRNISRLAVNASTGQLRHWGYQSTQVTNNRAQACMVADPSNHFVYVTNVVPASSGSGYATAVSMFSVNALNGNLTPKGAPYNLSEPIGCLQFHPNGKFAYATPAVSDSTQAIVTIARSSSGVLSIASTTPLPDEVGGLALDPAGRFLYVGTQQAVANALASAYGYSIDATNGELTPIPGTPFALPTNTGPLFSFHPSGDYLYLSDSNGTSIAEYSVDQITGVLTSGSKSPSPCLNPSALSFTPDGDFAFAACGEGLNGSLTARNLVSFAVHANGQLRQAGVSSAYLSPTSMIVDPSGRYLYLISSGSHYAHQNNGSYIGEPIAWLRIPSTPMGPLRN